MQRYDAILVLTHLEVIQVIAGLVYNYTFFSPHLNYYDKMIKSVNTNVLYARKTPGITSKIINSLLCSLSDASG